jgi:hypothetical protein
MVDTSVEAHAGMQSGPHLIVGGFATLRLLLYYTCQPEVDQMHGKPGGLQGRPNVSRALAETRKASRCAFDPVAPGCRMEAAFTLSIDGRKLHTAGLKAQGFSEAEICAIGSARRR